MKDTACVDFLQWALPKLHMRWPGFRKVRRQVCKRVRRRMRTLGLDHTEAYRAYLEAHPDEWDVLDAMCRITISRFYRDRGVFDLLRATLLPQRAQRATDETTLRCWSAGCASGEEVYTLKILWLEDLQPR
ncbi:MAG: CheR family methyltransferase, partial [Rhodothermales bacterium]